MIPYVQSLFAETGLWTALASPLVAGLMPASRASVSHADGADLRHPVRLGRDGGDRGLPSNSSYRCSSSRRSAACRLEGADAHEHRGLPRHAGRVWLLASVDKNTIVTSVSAVIVAFVMLMWTGWKYTGRALDRRDGSGRRSIGAMMATTSVGGPPVLLYLLSGNDPPQVNRANIVTYYFLTQFLLIVIVLADRRGGRRRPGPRRRAVPGDGAGRVGRRPAVPWAGERAALPQRRPHHPLPDGPVRASENWLVA